MSLTYGFVGWFHADKINSIADQLSLLPGMSATRESHNRFTNLRTLVMGVRHKDEKYDCFAKSYSIEIMVESDNPNIITFALDMTAMCPIYIKTSLNIIDIAGRIFDIIQPIIAISIIHGFEENFITRASVIDIVEHSYGLCYISENLTPGFERDENPSLYRVRECEHGHIFASPFGAGNEHIDRISGRDDVLYDDEELNELLKEAYNKHVPAIRTLVGELDLPFDLC